MATDGWIEQPTDRVTRKRMLQPQSRLLNNTIPWSSIVAVACAVIVWLCYSVSGSTSLLLPSAALSTWVTQMTTTVTRATPSGTHAEGGAVDKKTALQAFTAIRLSDSPKEYKQLFNSATVATDPPKGSPRQVMIEGGPGTTGRQLQLGRE
eukprot:421782-Amphidinium_carterae.2